ncbi:tetratricopeptide repeat protein [bacterium]|nr:tetratricopeptide repeat protein [bacterium]
MTSSLEAPGHRTSADEFQRVAVLILVLLAVIPFLPTVPFGFLANWDDDRYVLQNPWLGAPSLERILGVFVRPYYFNYHPLTILSYQLEHLFWGAWAPGYRTVNLVLHAVFCLLLFGLLRRMGSSVLAALAGAALFATHPMRVEAVVWISERKELLCGAFYLGAVLLWIHPETPNLPRRKMLTFAAVAGAFLSKPMAVSLPVALLLYDVLLRPGALRRNVPFHALSMVLVILFSWLNMGAQTGAINPHLPLVERFWLAVYAPWHYLATTLVPVGLSPLYPIELRPTGLPIIRLVAALCVTAIGALALYNWRRSPRVTWGLLAAGVALVPVSGIVGFGSAWAADRYSYIPTALALVALVPAVESLASTRRLTGWALRAVVGIVVALQSALTVSYGRHWEDATALWSRALDRYPESSKARQFLADALSIEAGSTRDPGVAARLWSRALELNPADGKAAMAVAEGLEGAGRRNELAEHLRRTLAAPDAEATVQMWANAKLGLLAAEDGDQPTAAQYFDRAFANPINSWKTAQDLLFVGWYAEQAGRLETAVALYDEARRREPVNAEVLQSLAFTHLAMGDRAKALTYLREAARLAPDNRDLRANLARMEQETSK